MSRNLKLILFAVSALMLALSSVIIGALSLDEENFRAFLGWAIERSSGYTVTIQGPLSVDLSMTPSVRASKVIITPPDDAYPLRMSRIGEIHARVALAPLLHGKVHLMNLSVDDAAVSWDPRKKSPESGGLTVEVPDAAVVKNSTLTILPYAHMRALNLYLENLQLRHDTQTGSLLLKGAGAINNNPIRIDGLCGRFAAAFIPDRFFPVDFALRIADMDMKISGTIDDPEHWEGMHLNVDIHEGEAATFLHILGIRSGPMGRMHAQAQLGGSIESPGISGLSIVFTGSPFLSLAVSGTIPDLKNGDRAFLKVSGACSDTALLRLLSPGELMITAVDFKGEVQGTRQGIAVENIRASAVAGGQVRVRAAGMVRLGPRPYPLSAWVFSLRGELASPTTRALSFTSKQSLPEMGPVRGKFLIKGTPGRFALQDLDVTLGNARTLAMNWTGGIGKVEPGGKTPVSSLKLAGSLTADTLARLTPHVKKTLPDLGPLSSRCDLRDKDGGYSLENVRIVLGNADDFGMEAVGSAGIGMRGNRVFMDRVALRCTAHASDAHTLMRRLGMEKSAIETFSGSFDLEGRPDNLSLRSVRLEAGMMEGGTISLKGSVGHLDLNDPSAVKGIDLALKGLVPDSRIFSKLSGLDLPDLGAISLDARLGDKKGTLDLNPFELRAEKGRERVLTMSGRVHDALNLQGFYLVGAFETFSKTVFRNSLQQSRKKPFPIRGKILARGDAGQVHIQELQVASPTPGEFFIEMKGAVSHTSGTPTFKGTLLSNILDLSLITPGEGASPASLGAFHADGRVMIKPDSMSYDGVINLGRTRFTADVSASAAGKRPRIVAGIHAPTIYLNDRAAAPDGSTAAQAAVKHPHKAAGRRIFDTAPLHIDMPRAFDASIRLSADSITDVKSTYSIHDVRIDASLEKGILQLSPVTFQYAKGGVSMDLAIDSRGKTPDVKLSLTADDMDIATLEDYLRKPHVLDGKMSVSAYMHGQGATAREMASTLEGDVGFAIEDGTLNRNVELLGGDGMDVVLSFTESIAGDALDLLLPSAGGKKDIALNCMVARFTFSQGVGLSRVIAYDTRDYRVSGVGTLDLGKETMNLVLRPKSKKKLYDWSSSPIYITGPISNPSLKKVPYREAARLSGEIFAPYVFLPARGMGYLWYILKKDSEKNSSCSELNLDYR